MATAARAVVAHSDDIKAISWNLKTADPDGAVVGPQDGNYADRTITVSGTWGGATFAMQGSNDGATWFTLNDLFSVDVTGTGNLMFSLAEAPLYMRPNLTAVGAGADLTAILAMRKRRSGKAI